MKAQQLVLATILILAAVSCTEEVSRPSSIVDCPYDFSSYPKDSMYTSILEKYVDQGLPGVSVAIIDAEEGLWMGTAGYANIEDGIEMNPCHLHHSASIAKMWIATLTLLLWEEGRIDLDACIDNYLPDSVSDNLPNGHKATVRQLMNHTSGIPEYNSTLTFNADSFNDPGAVQPTGELLGYISGFEPVADTGELHYYSDANYMVLTLVLDDVTGSHTREFEQRFIYGTGYTDTYYHNGGYPWLDEQVNSYFDRYGNKTLENVSDWQIAATERVKGADGMIAAPADYAWFLRRLCTSQILSDSAFTEMSEFVPDPDYPEYEYGLGLATYPTPYGTWIGHGGATLGAAGFTYHLPDSNVTIVMFSNIGTFFATPLADVFYEDLTEEMMAAVFD